MKLDITDKHFIELYKKGYSIDMVVILGWVQKELPMDHIIAGSKKIEVLYNTMKRKSLIGNDGKITKPGIEILDFVDKKTNTKFEKTKVHSSAFDEWWEIFPTTDEFEYKGRVFHGTRSLRTGKPKARLYFDKYILEGTYTKEQIMNATLYDVEMRKKSSLRSGRNNLTYLQNAATYLFNESFEPFIKYGEIKIEQKESTNKLGSIDI